MGFDFGGFFDNAIAGIGDAAQDSFSAVVKQAPVWVTDQLQKQKKSDLVNRPTFDSSKAGGQVKDVTINVPSENGAFNSNIIIIGGGIILLLLLFK